MAPSRIFNEYGVLSGIMFSREMTRDDMLTVSEDFANAALQLKDVGFDAVEVHMGHGYLLSQFLSPKTNLRKDEFGGRFLRVKGHKKVMAHLMFGILVLTADQLFRLII